MFARRKPRPSEEDEPLVPHGLIWQATETPAFEDEEGVCPPAGGVEIPIRQTTSEAIPERENSEPQGTISPPLAWPSPNIQEIRRPHLVVRHEDPAVLPSAQGPAGGPEPVRPALSAILRSRLDTLRGQLSVRRSRLQHLAAGAVERSGQLIARMRKRALEVPARARSLHGAADVQKQIDRVRNFAARQAERSASQAQRISLPRPSWPATLPIPQSARSAATRVKLWLGALPSSAQRVWNHRFRIRIQTPGLSGAVVAQKFSALRDSARAHWRNDSRLWTSMVAGALSALLALGMISFLKRYDPVQATTQPSPAAQAPHPATMPARPRLQKPNAAEKPPARKTQSISAVKPKPAKRKPHRNPDEDYVARDTYVYYGN